MAETSSRDESTANRFSDPTSLARIREIAKKFEGLECVDFPGFEAKWIISGVEENAKKAGIDGTQLKQDITDIVLVGLSKGNLPDDQFTQFKQIPSIRLQELKQRYKIRTRAKKAAPISTSYNSITFARSLRVFPTVASDLIQRGLYVPKPTQNFLLSNDLPAVFKHSGFAALIPKRNRVGSVYFYAFLGYMIDFSFTINPASSTRSVQIKFNDEHHFASKAWDGELIVFAKRVQLMKKYEINTREVLETCVKVANKLLSQVGKETFDAEKIMKTYVNRNHMVDFEIVDEEGSSCRSEDK